MPTWLWIFLLLLVAAFFCHFLFYPIICSYIYPLLYVYLRWVIGLSGGESFLLSYSSKGCIYSTYLKYAFGISFFLYLITPCANLVMSLLHCSVIGHSEGRNFRILIPFLRTKCRYSQDLPSLSPDYDRHIVHSYQRVQYNSWAE